MKKRTIALVLGILALVLTVICCACTKEPEIEEPTFSGFKVFETEMYSMILPENMSVEEGKDGKVTLYSDDYAVGGILSFEYKDSYQLNMEEILNEECQKSFDRFLNSIAPVIAPEGYSAHMFSSNLTSDFSLSIVPLSDKNNLDSEAKEIVHYFFLDENKIYDLFIERGKISPLHEEMLLDGFSI